MKLKIKNLLLLAIFVIALGSITGCSKEDESIGVGPIKKVDLKPVDQSLADKGKNVFEAKCVACHTFETKLVGPSLSGVTKRRKPEWIMNMILNPEQMTKENPTARQLLAENMTQMTFQDVTQDDARAILEYFRVKDGEK